MTFIYTPPEPTYAADVREKDGEDCFSEELLRAEVERVRRETVEACAKFFADNGTNMFWGSQVAAHLQELLK